MVVLLLINKISVLSN